MSHIALSTTPFNNIDLLEIVPPPSPPPVEINKNNKGFGAVVASQTAMDVNPPPIPPPFTNKIRKSMNESKQHVYNAPPPSVSPSDIFPPPTPPPFISRKKSSTSAPLSNVDIPLPDHPPRSGEITEV
jgi:hypothetical protein